MNSARNFVDCLLNVIPETRQIYDAHIEDYGVLLSHVFMGDLTQFVLQLSQSDVNRDVLHRVFLLVEEGLASGAPDVSELVAVSFIENLCGEDEAIAILLPLAGDATKKELEAICGN